MLYFFLCRHKGGFSSTETSVPVFFIYYRPYRLDIFVRHIFHNTTIPQKCNVKT